MAGVAGGEPAPTAPTGVAEPRHTLAVRTARRWLRGEPLHVPTHAMFVHFPAALFPASFVLDLLAARDASSGARFGATVLLVFGLLGGVLAAGTGLLDWLDMIPGTARRARVTRHLLVQATAMVGFGIALAIQVATTATGSVPLPALALMAASTALILVGNHLGGLLVYRDGMRVGTRR